MCGSGIEGVNFYQKPRSVKCWRSQKTGRIYIPSSERKQPNIFGHNIRKNLKNNTYVMVPLPKLWHALESVASAPDGEADFAIADLLNLVD